MLLFSTIVNLVLEWPHLHLPDKLLSLQHLIVELGQHVPQQVPHQARLVVSRTDEGNKNHSSHIQIRVL